MDRPDVALDSGEAGNELALFRGDNPQAGPRSDSVGASWIWIAFADVFEKEPNQVAVPDRLFTDCGDSMDMGTAETGGAWTSSC